MKYELETMVETASYRRAYSALETYGFVLLVGEAASGKSTLAATLAMSAIDSDRDVQAIKIRSPQDFVKHYNPEDPRQFFWVDDAFGPTSFQRDLAEGWTRCFRELAAAIAQKAKVVFTTRDYIYGSAKSQMLLSAFPLMQTAQVVIEVSKLSTQEKISILYNHLRLGGQPAEFRTRIKKHAMSVAQDGRFIPEIARRLGNPFYTSSLDVSQSGLREFVANKSTFLVESIQKSGSGPRSVLIALFMAGGYIECPLNPESVSLKSALDFVGIRFAEFRDYLQELNGSLVMLEFSEGVERWTFRHPTLRDATAIVVSGDPELFWAYFQGTSIGDQLNEVRCQTMDVAGAQVVLPIGYYAKFAAKLAAVGDSAAIYFLADRADDALLKISIEQIPTLIPESIEKPDNAAARRFVSRCAALGVLAADQQAKFFDGLLQVARDQHIAAALTEPAVAAILSADERNTIAMALATEILDQIEDVVASMVDNYEGDGTSGEAYFDQILGVIEALEVHYFLDAHRAMAIERAREVVDGGIDSIEEMRRESEPPEDDRVEYGPVAFRDPFDDVDL